MLGCIEELAGVLRTRGGMAMIAAVVFALWLFVRLWRRTGTNKTAAGAHLATEIRCERHGLRLRLEASSQSAFDEARFHVQCPLCAMQSSRDV